MPCCAGSVFDAGSTPQSPHSLFQNRPLQCGLLLLPFLYFLCISVNVFAITYEGSHCNNIGGKERGGKFQFYADLGLDKWPLWTVLTMSIGAGIVAALITRLFVVGRLKNYILGLHCPNYIYKYLRIFSAHTIGPGDQQNENGGLKDVKIEKHSPRNGVLSSKSNNYRRIPTTMGVKNGGIESGNSAGQEQPESNKLLREKPEEESNSREAAPPHQQQKEEENGQQQNGTVGRLPPPYKYTTYSSNFSRQCHNSACLFSAQLHSFLQTRRSIRIQIIYIFASIDGLLLRICSRRK